LVDETENNLINIFLVGLREDLRVKVKTDKPLSMVSTYKSAYAREIIASAERKRLRVPLSRLM